MAEGLPPYVGPPLPCAAWIPALELTARPSRGILPQGPTSARQGAWFGTRSLAAADGRREMSTLAPMLIVALGAMATSGAQHQLSVEPLLGEGGDLGLGVASAVAGILAAGALLDLLGPMASGLVSLAEDQDGDRGKEARSQAQAAKDASLVAPVDGSPQEVPEQVEGGGFGSYGDSGQEHRRLLLLFRCPSRWTAGFGSNACMQPPHGRASPGKQQRGAWPGLEWRGGDDGGDAWRGALPVLELQASAGAGGWALEPFSHDAPMLWWVVGERTPGGSRRGVSAAVAARLAAAAQRSVLTHALYDFIGCRSPPRSPSSPAKPRSPARGARRAGRASRSPPQRRLRLRRRGAEAARLHPRQAARPPSCVSRRLTGRSRQPLRSRTRARRSPRCLRAHQAAALWPRSAARTARARARPRPGRSYSGGSSRAGQQSARRAATPCSRGVRARGWLDASPCGGARRRRRPPWSPNPPCSWRTSRARGAARCSPTPSPGAVGSSLPPRRCSAASAWPSGPTPTRPCSPLPAPLQRTSPRKAPRRRASACSGLRRSPRHAAARQRARRSGRRGTASFPTRRTTCGRRSGAAWGAARRRQVRARAWRPRRRSCGAAHAGWRGAGALVRWRDAEEGRDAPSAAAAASPLDEAGAGAGAGVSGERVPALVACLLQAADAGQPSPPPPPLPRTNRTSLVPALVLIGRAASLTGSVREAARSCSSPTAGPCPPRRAPRAARPQRRRRRRRPA
jgi:hypothetical protein